tara:strand:- start:193 stop:504 length:312 start_codon:yes stop_codon:yes gene_type:complete
MTRSKVLLIGLAFFALGGIGYAGFRFFGFDSANAGIAAQTLLIIVLIFWILTYLFRVFTGTMTFNEQRNRYRKAYEEKTTEELQTKLDRMSEEEKSILLQDLE